MIKYLFYPYLIQLFLFLYYTTSVFESIQEKKALEEAASLGTTPEVDVLGSQASAAFFLYANQSSLGLNFSDPASYLNQSSHAMSFMVTAEKSWTDMNVTEMLDSLFENQKQIIKIVILTLCGYFFLLNFRQFVTQGPAKYFSGPWNYIDLLPLTTITFTMIVEYFYDFPTTERAINSISVFFIWLKSLYFLRMFRSSSKFISMIVSVVADMRIFLAVFLICLVTFSQSLLIMSNNQANEEDRFTHSFFESLLFTYRISLGDWDTSGLGTTDFIIIVTLFILASFFLCIVMLNLLIAIISDTYAAVESTA